MFWGKPVGRLSADSGQQSASRPTDGRQSADSRPTVGRQSADRFFGELFFTITLSLDASIKRMTKSGQHSQGSTASALDELMKRAAQFNIFTQLEGRPYKHFYEFKRDTLENLNGPLLYQWINKHKKNTTCGIRARYTCCELSIPLLTYE